MRVLITGAAGMLGRKLVERLLAEGLRGRRVERLDLVDLVEAPVEDGRVRPVVADLSEPGVAADVAAAARPDVLFHLAGVVSGEAESDLDKGYRVNLDGTRSLYDAVRLSSGCPRVVFASSIAVFGAPFPDPIGDDFHLTPRTSYGTQKLIGEALLADHTRRGGFDGVGIRLPTISVRPGAPNLAASGFFSSIIREPLAGRQAVLPVSPEVRHPHASPRSAVGYLMRAAELTSEEIGWPPNLTMPSVSVTVAEQLAALERVAGPQVRALVRHEPDEAVAAIVAGWPRRFATRRAAALGFACEADFDQIIRVYLEDDHPG